MKWATILLIGHLLVTGIECQDVDLCKEMLDYPKSDDMKKWRLVFNDEFDGPGLNFSQWQNKKTSAYPYPGKRNPDPNENKLDSIDPALVKVQNVNGRGWAVFDAWYANEPWPSTTQPYPYKSYWNTGLLTTEPQPEADVTHPFKVRTNDYIESLFILPAEHGAWPGLWTWNGPTGEVDSFEYHPEHPYNLELTCRVRHPSLKGDAEGFHNPTTIRPGNTVTIGTHYGEKSVTWYINGCRAYSTPNEQGVGLNWETYIILNLSICAGVTSNEAPTVNHIQFWVDYVKVWRNM